MLTAEGYEVHTAFDGGSALVAIERHSPDLILLDVQLPGLDGFEICRRVKQIPETRLIPVVMVTGLQARDDRIAGINAGADDFLLKPFDVGELQARVRSLLRLKRYTDELDSAEAVILSLALTVEARDAYTEGHCHRLASYATALGEDLSLADDELSRAPSRRVSARRWEDRHSRRRAAKPGKLTDDEFDLMKQHTVIGERLCGNLRLFRPVPSILRLHHERLDGSGYPDGLRGDEIPLLAQIVGIADVYDALTTTQTVPLPPCHQRRPSQSSAEMCATERAARTWSRRSSR